MQLSRLKGGPITFPSDSRSMGGAFYITSKPGAKKLKNITANYRVCLIIDVAQKPRKAIMVQGLATLVERGEEFERINEFISQQRGWKKWAEGEQVAIKIEPTKKVSWGI